jgi:hypothetical protein
MGQGISKQIFKNQQWTCSKEDSQLALFGIALLIICYIGITNPILGYFGPGPFRNMDMQLTALNSLNPNLVILRWNKKVYRHCFSIHFY